MTNILNLQNSILGSIYWKDLNFVYRGCNEYAAKMAGLKDEASLIGKTDYDIFEKEIADAFRENDMEVIKSENRRIVEEKITMPDGSVLIQLSLKNPLRDANGKVFGVIGNTVDITYLKKIEEKLIKDKKLTENEAVEKLKETGNTLNAILDIVAGIHWWKDLQGIYRGCNEEMVRILGLSSKNDIIGKTDYELPWAEQADELINNDRIVSTTKIVQKGKEELIRSNDGELLVFLVSKTPIFDSRGNVIGVAGTSVDVTMQKKLEQELIAAKEKAEAANQAKTEFVQNMQHDIRTPSSGLWGVLDVLAKTEKDSDRKEALDMAVAASKRLLDLCNDAVEFGDLSGHSRPQLAKAFDIRDVAKSVVELNLPAVFTKDLLLHFSIDLTVPVYIVSDEFRISRILINLLGNAIKFSHRGEVTLSIKANLDEENPRNGVLIIEVEDQGIGISQDKIIHIFEKFTRGIASNTNKYPGIGLGLYVVKTFVDELDGDIYAQSHENEGTYFKLSIPFKVLWEDVKKPGIEIDEHFKSSLRQKGEKERSTKDEKMPSDKAPFTHKLLIIEDDKTCLFAEKNLLSIFTHHIDTAENVTEALKKLALKRYDLVISDLGLPDGSGNDIVAKIKVTPESPNYNTPFVAMTAHQDTLKHQQVMEAGFTAINTKPLGTKKAVELLNTYPALGTAALLKEKGLAVIDLALGMQRIAAKNEDAAIEALNILLETLQEDIPVLKEAQKNNDIAGAREVLHKIRGGLFYSGAPRLEEAFMNLHREVKLTSDLSTIDKLFSLTYDEVQLFSEQLKKLIFEK